MRHISWIFAVLLMFAGIAACPGLASAYQIGGRFGSSCHEEIGLAGFLTVMPLMLGNEDAIILPTDNTTLKMIEQVQRQIHNTDGSELTMKQAFIMASLLAGVRAPDTEGHASTNLAHTRAEHSDPDDDAQYIHFLRGKNDDHQEGGINAVRGSTGLFKALLQKAMSYRSVVGTTNNIHVDLFIDYYGMVDLELNGVAYYFGIVAHQVADSFSHTIRSEADDFTKIIDVMNYVEAIFPEYDGDRDGPRHSDSYDNCEDEAIAPLVARAKDATMDLTQTFKEYYITQDEAVLDAFAERWFTMREDCYNNYALCNSEHWLDVAKSDETHAYLECSSMPERPAPWYVFALFGLLAVIGTWRIARKF
ncbi:MAG: hypothetical protein IJU23_09355 [Proteobacteria bacterium]|nr:hypothetical protein [Pseudomonadota bacterium]